MKGHGSRIKGQGAILRSLRQLVRRVDRYGQHRAATPNEWGWCNRLADDLELAYRRASTPQSMASLDAVNRRVRLSRKTAQSSTLDHERINRDAICQ
jgi:hypothetical protein